MIHRSRRHLATLPARRGMRAHWLRRRNPDEVDAAPRPEPAAAESPEPEGLAAETEEGPSAVPEAVRPAFGHPTF